MAYSMSQENSPTLTYEYEVFVSFSAEDTHKNSVVRILNHLRRARKGFQICDIGKHKLLFEFEEETNVDRVIMGEPSGLLLRPLSRPSATASSISTPTSAVGSHSHGRASPIQRDRPLYPLKTLKTSVTVRLEELRHFLTNDSATQRRKGGRDASILLGLLKEFIPISSLFLRVYSKDHYGKDAGTYVLLRWLLR
ncbi:hypothetical protein CFP56_018766 [Quercus suber]|uniref:TIR domain-containing protein n=1 Tax=Quercus suber TaxID=58331 RepID=A0AAW0KKZ5_QUESU